MSNEREMEKEVDTHNIGSAVACDTAPDRLTTGAAMWRVNLREETATHESGLVLRFAQLPLTQEGSKRLEGLTGLDLCWLPLGYPVWAVMADPDAVNAMLQALPVAGTSDQARLLIALACAAGRAWIKAVLAAEQTAVRRELGAEPQDAPAPRLQSRS